MYSLEDVCTVDTIMIEISMLKNEIKELSLIWFDLAYPGILEFDWVAEIEKGTRVDKAFVEKAIAFEQACEGRSKRSSSTENGRKMRWPSPGVDLSEVLIFRLWNESIDVEVELIVYFIVMLRLVLWLFWLYRPGFGRVCFVKIVNYLWKFIWTRL